MNLQKQNLVLSSFCLVLVIILIALLMCWWFENQINVVDYKINELQNF